MVIHHLCHSGSDATSKALTTSNRIYRAIHVVRGILIPLAGEHWGDGGAVVGFSWGAGHSCAVLLEILNILGIAVEPGLEVAGEVVEVDVPLIGVAEDGIGAVVTAGDDIALVVADVEDVIGLEFVGLGITHRGVTQRGEAYALAAVLHEGQSVVLGLLAGDGGCCDLHCGGETTHYQQGQYRFYTLRFHHCHIIIEVNYRLEMSYDAKIVKVDENGKKKPSFHARGTACLLHRQ